MGRGCRRPDVRACHREQLPLRILRVRRDGMDGVPIGTRLSRSTIRAMDGDK